MRVTREFLESAIAGDYAASRQLFSVLRKCAAIGSHKAHGGDHADDIEQELWMFLVHNIERIDTQYNIEPYFIDTARRMTLARKRKYASFGTDGEDHRVDGIANLAGGESSTFTEAENALIDANDQRSAMSYLLSHSPAVAAAATQGNETMSVRYKADNKETAKRLSPDHEKIRNIRLKAGLSQPEMASRLGLKVSTLQSYEYGRTKKVKKEVLEAAERMSIDPMYPKIDSRYENTPIKEIAEDWMKRLGLRSYRALADLLSLDRSTITRWFADKSKDHDEPSIRQIVEYERVVVALEKQMEGSARGRR